ncbi:MAG: hypothetical protein HQL33_01900 [Alphaproteobacteria bacterium]|nr:hypothetical protein [Alphaproteobacteria bacterium]
MSLLAQTVAVDAQTIIDPVDARGKTKEEAETYAARGAVRRALIDHYGVAPDNPLIGIISEIDADKLKNEFLRPPGGVPRKAGDSYEGKLQYELNDARSQDIINKTIASELAKQQISVVALAVTATSTARPLDSATRAKMTNDLTREFGSTVTYYGLKGGAIPPDLMATMVSKVSGGADPGAAIIKDIDWIAQKASMTEQGKADVVIAGYFNINEEKNEGKNINWEMRGTLYHFQKDATDVAKAGKQEFSIRGNTIGDSREGAIQTVYEDSTKKLIVGKMFQQLMAARKSTTPVVVMCGDFDLDQQIELEEALQKMVTNPNGTAKKADRIEVKDKSFSVFGTGVTATDVYKHLKDFIKSRNWKPKIVDERLLVGELDKCG